MTSTAAERSRPDHAEVVRVSIDGESDLLQVRSALRTCAGQAALGLTATTKLVTAGSELARNILLYAGHGTAYVEPAARQNLRGVKAEFIDTGPGIADLDQVMQDGFSTAGSLGLGLPGSRRLVDEFTIDSTPGQGTRVVIVQWGR
jgi:serine/threonine-protein kinase RsbT